MKKKTQAVLMVYYNPSEASYAVATEKHQPPTVG